MGSEVLPDCSKTLSRGKLGPMEKGKHKDPIGPQVVKAVRFTKGSPIENKQAFRASTFAGA